MENSDGGFGNLFVDINTFEVNHAQNPSEMGIARFEHKRPSPSLDNLFSNREVLAKRLKNRPAKEDLVDRHIIPAHSAAPSIYDRVTLLERKKTGDFLQKKIRARPSRQQLIQRHILSDRCVDASLYENIGKLERQKIADQLNEHLLARPGPIELIQDRILPVESPIQSAIENASFEATLSPTSSTLDTPSVSELESNLDCTSPSPPLSSNDPFSDSPYRNPCSNLTDKLFRQVSEPNISKLTISQNFSISQKENEKLVRSIGKKTKPTKPRVKKLKFHECRPPDMPADSSIGNPVDERYQQLLEQQTLYLRLQVMQQNAVLNALNGNTNSIDSVTEEIENIIKKEKKTVSPDLKSIKGKKLDELRVIDLRAHLKHRGLLVSGPKAKLIQRLLAFEEGKSSPSDFSYASNMNETPLVESPTAVTSVDVTPTTVMQVTTYATDANTGQTYQVVQTVPQQTAQSIMQYQNSVSPIHMDHVNIQPVIAVTQPHVMTIRESIPTTTVNTSDHLSIQPIQYQMTTPPQQPSPTIVLHQDPPVQRAALMQHDKLKTEVQRLTAFSTSQCLEQDKLSQSLPAVPFNTTYLGNNTTIDLNHQHKNEHSLLSTSNSLDLRQYRVRTSSEPQDQYQRSYSYTDSNQYQLQNGVDKNANVMEVVSPINRLVAGQFTKSTYHQHSRNQIGSDDLKTQENYDEIMDILGELSTPSPSNTVSPSNTLQIKTENPPPYIPCVFNKQQEQPRNQFSNRFLSLSNTKQFSSVPENINALGNSPSQNCPSTPYGSLGTNSHSGSMSNLQLQQSNSFDTLNQCSSTGNILQLQRSDSHQSLSNGSYRNTNTPTNYLKMDYNQPPMSPMSIGDDNLNMELEQLTSNQNQALSWLDLNIDTSLQFPTYATKNINTSESYSGLSNASGMLEMNSTMIPQNNLYGSNTRTQTSIYGSSPQPNDGFVSLFELEGGGY